MGKTLPCWDVGAEGAMWIRPPFKAFGPEIDILALRAGPPSIDRTVRVPSTKDSVRVSLMWIHGLRKHGHRWGDAGSCWNIETYRNSLIKCLQRENVLLPKHVSTAIYVYEIISQGAKCVCSRVVTWDGSDILFSAYRSRLESRSIPRPALEIVTPDAPS